MPNSGSNSIYRHKRRFLAKIGGMDRNDHIAKRESTLGRWLPATFYVANIASWLATAVTIGSTQFLVLSLFTLPALALYLWRTRNL
jgi:hypothetical protein